MHRAPVVDTVRFLSDIKSCREVGLACYHLGSFQDQHVLWWEPWDLITEVSWADTCVGRMIPCCLRESLQYLPTRNFVINILQITQRISLHVDFT